MPERKPSSIIKDILNCIGHVQLYTSNLKNELPSFKIELERIQSELLKKNM